LTKSSLCPYWKDDFYNSSLKGPQLSSRVGRAGRAVCLHQMQDNYLIKDFSLRNIAL